MAKKKVETGAMRQCQSAWDVLPHQVEVVAASDLHRWLMSTHDGRGIWAGRSNPLTEKWEIRFSDERTAFLFKLWHG